MYRLESKRTEKTNRRKREREFFETEKTGVHWSCYVLLFTDFVNYWTLVFHAQWLRSSR